MKRVVVTGMGAITPIGNSVDEFWAAVKKQTVGIGEITKMDATDYKVKLAAEEKGYVARGHMDAKTARRMEAFCHYAVAATEEALKDSGLDLQQEDPYRVGVSIGSGIGSLQTIEREFQKLLKGGPRKVSPLMVPMLISNMAAGNVSILFGLKGKSINVVTACATGTHSIGEAFRTIQYGDAEVMVAGGTESAITPSGMAGFTSLTALTTAEDPLRASIPFDKERGGFVMGEGAGVVVLEELEHALKRNAKIYAEIVGYGATSDAFHITSPAEDGSGAAKAMEMAMADAKVTPADVDYINAHGTGTHHNDLFETKAIKLAMKEEASRVKISSTKSMVGHLLGAAGGVEFITCVKSIEDNYLHPTVGYRVPDEECDLDYITDGPVEQEVNCCLSNSLGFGGHNATLCVKRFEK